MSVPGRWIIDLLLFWSVCSGLDMTRVRTHAQPPSQASSRHESPNSHVHGGASQYYVLPGDNKLGQWNGEEPHLYEFLRPKKIHLHAAIFPDELEKPHKFLHSETLHTKSSPHQKQSHPHVLPTLKTFLVPSHPKKAQPEGLVYKEHREGQNHVLGKTPKDLRQLHPGKPHPHASAWNGKLASLMQSPKNRPHGLPNQHPLEILHQEKPGSYNDRSDQPHTQPHSAKPHSRAPINDGKKRPVDLLHNHEHRLLGVEHDLLEFSLDQNRPHYSVVYYSANYSLPNLLQQNKQPGIPHPGKPQSKSLMNSRLDETWHSHETPHHDKLLNKTTTVRLGEHHPLGSALSGSHGAKDGGLHSEKRHRRGLLDQKEPPRHTIIYHSANHTKPIQEKGKHASHYLRNSTLKFRNPTDKKQESTKFQRLTPQDNVPLRLLHGVKSYPQAVTKEKPRPKVLPLKKPLVHGFQTTNKAHVHHPDAPQYNKTTNPNKKKSVLQGKAPQKKAPVKLTNIQPQKVKPVVKSDAAPHYDTGHQDAPRLKHNTSKPSYKLFSADGRVLMGNAHQPTKLPHLHHKVAPTVKPDRKLYHQTRHHEIRQPHQVKLIKETRHHEINQPLAKSIKETRHHETNQPKMKAIKETRHHEINQPLVKLIKGTSHNHKKSPSRIPPHFEFLKNTTMEDISEFVLQFKNHVIKHEEERQISLPNISQKFNLGSISATNGRLGGLSSSRLTGNVRISSLLGANFTHLHIPIFLDKLALYYDNFKVTPQGKIGTSGRANITIQNAKLVLKITIHPTRSSDDCAFSFDGAYLLNPGKVEVILTGLKVDKKLERELKRYILRFIRHNKFLYSTVSHMFYIFMSDLDGKCVYIDEATRHLYMNMSAKRKQKTSARY